LDKPLNFDTQEHLGYDLAKDKGSPYLLLTTAAGRDDRGTVTMSNTYFYKLQ
jgi:hypothetical protein